MSTHQLPAELAFPTIKMKLIVVIATLLGIFLAPALANGGNNGGNSQQTLSIDKDNHVANIDANDGSNSWNSVWDYNTGFAATRVYLKKACIISKIDRNIFPFIVLAPPPPPGDQVLRPRPLSVPEYHFTVSRRRIRNLAPYGKPIQALCGGIPTYMAYPAPGSNFSKQDGPCFKIHVDKVTLNYCSLY